MKFRETWLACGLLLLCALLAACSTPPRPEVPVQARVELPFVGSCDASMGDNVSLEFERNYRRYGFYPADTKKVECQRGDRRVEATLVEWRRNEPVQLGRSPSVLRPDEFERWMAMHVPGYRPLRAPAQGAPRVVHGGGARPAADADGKIPFVHMMANPTWRWWLARANEAAIANVFERNDRQMIALDAATLVEMYRAASGIDFGGVAGFVRMLRSGEIFFEPCTAAFLRAHPLAGWLRTPDGKVVMYDVRNTMQGQRYACERGEQVMVHKASGKRFAMTGCLNPVDPPETPTVIQVAAMVLDRIRVAFASTWLAEALV